MRLLGEPLTLGDIVPGRRPQAGDLAVHPAQVDGQLLVLDRPANEQPQHGPEPLRHLGDAIVGQAELQRHGPQALRRRRVDPGAAAGALDHADQGQHAELQLADVRDVLLLEPRAGEDGRATPEARILVALQVPQLAGAPHGPIRAPGERVVGAQRVVQLQVDAGGILDGLDHELVGVVPSSRYPSRPRCVTAKSV